MSTYNDIDELIDLYLQGSMDKAQNEAFRLRIDRDPELAKKVEEMRIVNEVVLGAELDYLREKITNDLHKKEITKTRKRRLLYSTAFITVLTASISGYFISKNNSDKIEKTDTTTPIDTIATDTLYNLPVKDTVDTIDEETPSVNKNNQTTIHAAGNQSTVTSTIIDEHNPTQKVDKDTVDQIIKTTPQKVSPEYTIKDTANTSIKTPIKDTLKQTVPCDKININPKTEASCLEKPTGSIVVRTEDIEGGTAPYVLYLNTSKIEYEVIENLPAGDYELKVVDKNNCKTTHTLSIASKVCKRVQSFSFNPDYGETWNVPTSKENATLYIYSRAGLIVFQTNINSMTYEWDGKDKNGISLTEGLYIYMLEYNSGEKENGQITIVR